MSVIGRESATDIRFSRAYYVKLGHGGVWAKDAIAKGIVRLGWPSIPLSEIHEGNWARIRERLAKEHHNKGTVTSDTERLRDLATSTPKDVWITFHESRLWWSRMADSPIEEDEISKYRRLFIPWTDKDASGRLLLANQIPGRISQVQGFRGTVCRVRDHEALERLLNAQSSPAYLSLQSHKVGLIAAVVPAIQQLHWKDFETLVDLVFRQAGWRRRSVSGETMKYADLELEEPVTGDSYQVQIKSRADVKDFRTYESAFSSQGFRKLYFVVHSPTDALRKTTGSEDVELILPERLAEMVVEHGLVRWLGDRVR